MLYEVITYVVWQGASGESRRREIEQSLRNSENKYRLLAETAREFILLFDSSFTISYANSAWIRVSGYLLADMKDIRLIDLIPEIERE